MTTKTAVPDVVGAIETKEILGVELGRITRWRKAGKLPPPYCQPACSPVWLREDIERFRDGDRDGFTDPPDEAPLLGTAEAAELIGVDKSQIGRWRRTPPKTGPAFPEPATKIKAGRLWARADIVRFAESRRAA